MKRILYWLKYRKQRRESAHRAASLATQLVLNGCLTPPRLAGAKGRIGAGTMSDMATRQRFQAIIGREGWA